MTQRLAGKVALITGGASGIGAAHVRVFAQAGARVVAGDVQEKLGESVAEAVRSAGGDVVFVKLDVTSPEDWARAVATAVERYGKLTSLVNNAGIYHPGGVEDETMAGWQKMIAINQTGPWLGMKAAMPELLKTGNASIVNISSLFGIVGSPGSFSYHATKAAVRLMSKSAGLEYAKRGVRVNSIHPGQIQTPILGDITPEMDRAIKAAIPMGRVGDPEDIAYGSVYLCSDEAKYVTATEMVIDGGWGAG
ncbi:MAG TPA: glucose 1-dehydrogenase [Steroidobacteraceae bacterium]|jgi:2,5-dichloro-2,5-cyclohexadiene-1,4-diol dehydrogenase 2|nr:glucose 1-dehydrogenase [Steroidobacteraceae bacterium]HTG76018.1 glucose 1-dehydrogenase [Steroidobacteraceae bacterium]